MEDRAQIEQESLLAALQYFRPILMELQLDQKEEASYTHKFFVRVAEGYAISAFRCQMNNAVEVSGRNILCHSWLITAALCVTA